MRKIFKFSTTSLLNMDNYSQFVKQIFSIYNVSTIKNPSNNTLIFATQLNENNKVLLQNVSNSIIIISKEYEKDFIVNNNVIIFSERPRKEYAILLKHILDCQPYEDKNYTLKNGYYVGENVKIGENSVIEPYVFIDHNVVIGERCIIRTGAKIRKNVVIGDNCIIKENCVIGDEGFGVERDEDGTTYKIPHLGGVHIGNNVEVGALSCICQGTIDPTVIEDYVKIDDCAFIAHNCFVGRGTFIIAGAEVSGSVHIGRNSWIGPNACIRDKITIGDNVLIGMGAVVVKDIASDLTVMGNPARPIEKKH